MNLTELQADFVANLAFTDLAPETIDQVKVCLMDWLGVCLAGSSEPAVQKAWTVAKSAGGVEESTLIGRHRKTSAIFAALVNGISGHALDFDDIYLWGPGHPSCTVLPGLLAVAEARGGSGKEFIAAATAGYQVQYSVGEGVMPQHTQQGWHNTGTLGHLGAGAACAKLLGLGPAAVKSAIGIAATQAAGMRNLFGTMSKPFHAGKAAMDGLLAALLAEQGFTGSDDPLGGKEGFLEVYANGYDGEKIARAVGGQPVVERVRFKRYPSCFATHGLIEAMALIRAKYGVGLNDVLEADCVVHPRGLKTAGLLYPRTGLEAKFSMAYCAAVALQKGTVTLEDFTDASVQQKNFTAFIEKIRFIPEPSFDPTRTAAVTLRLTNRRVANERVSIVEMGEDRLIAKKQARQKFVETVSAVKSLEEADRLLEQIDHLEQLPGIGPLIGQLS